MHTAGGSAGTESTCNAGDLGDPWAGKIPWRRNSLHMTWGIPWTVYSPWGHKDSYTTEWLSLSLWHMASGRLIEETKNDNSSLLGAWPSQSKMGLEGGRRHGMFTVRAQTLGAWGGKGATCEDASWYADGPGGAPWSQSRSRSDVRGGDPASLLFVTRRGVLKETHPPRLVIKRWLEDSNSSPATLSRANPRGKVEKLSGQTKNQVAWDPPLKGLGSLTIGNKWQ